uniref:Uncharacterized protein n=1 Tax=Plectus sambesii TaxID=2011161 RepID=A0A914VBU4_9BILA
MPIGILVVQAILTLGSFFGYSILCILLNDKSRDIQAHLYDIGPVSETVYQWLDFFQRRTIDNNWGVTLGKFFILERTALISIIGTMTTIVAFYAQFNSIDPSKAKFTGFDFKEMLKKET